MSGAATFGQAFYSPQLTSFTQSIQRSGTAFRTAMDADVFESIRYGGDHTFSVRTLTPFQWRIGDAAPITGTVKVIGANNSSLRADVANTAVQITLDTDGNGTPDGVLTTTFGTWTH